MSVLTPMPDFEMLALTIKHNCEVKGESPKLSTRPWFLNKKLSDRTSGLLLQLTRDCDHNTSLFSTIAARQVICLSDAKDAIEQMRSFIVKERQAAEAAIGSIDDGSVSTSSVQFKLAYIGEGPGLAAEIKVGEVTHFLTTGVKVNLELDLNDAVLLGVYIDSVLVGEEQLTLEPKTYSTASLVDSQVLSFMQDLIIAGVKVCLDITLTLNSQTKQRLLHSKLIQLDKELKRLDESQNDYSDLISALDIKVAGKQVRSKFKRSASDPKFERDCECCHVF